MPPKIADYRLDIPLTPEQKKEDHHYLILACNGWGYSLEHAELCNYYRISRLYKSYVKSELHNEDKHNPISFVIAVIL